MVNNVTPEMTIDLLEEAGVNKTVISYLKKNPTLLYEKTKKIIGTDFAPEVFHFKSQYVEKIKNGSDSFKILDNGDIWLSNFKTLENTSVHNGLFRDPANDKYKNITQSITLTTNEGHIVKRTITHKGFVQDNQYCYDGNILQENFDNNNNLVDGIEGRWENSQSMSLPNNVYSFSFFNNSFTNNRETKMDGHYVSTDTPEWQLTSNGVLPKSNQEFTESIKKENPIIGKFKLMKDKAQQLLGAKKDSPHKQELKEFQEIEKSFKTYPMAQQKGVMSTEEILLQAQRNSYSSSNSKQR